MKRGRGEGIGRRGGRRNEGGQEKGERGGKEEEGKRGMKERRRGRKQRKERERRGGGKGEEGEGRRKERASKGEGGEGRRVAPTSFMSCSTRGSWSVVMLTQRGSVAIGEPAPSCNTWGGGGGGGGGSLKLYFMASKSLLHNYIQFHSSCSSVITLRGTWL